MCRSRVSRLPSSASMAATSWSTCCSKSRSRRSSTPQTAVEAAVTLHPQVDGRIDDIDRIVMTTHESAIRIISKTGDLNNPADRDHCLQYMAAIGLLKG